MANEFAVSMEAATIPAKEAPSKKTEPQDEIDVKIEKMEAKLAAVKSRLQLQLQSQLPPGDASADNFEL